METLFKIFPGADFGLLPWILGLPLLGALVNGVFGKRLGKEAVSLMALVAVGASFVASVVSFFMLQDAQQDGEGARFTWTGWEWMHVSNMNEATALSGGGEPGMLTLDVTFSVDALSGTMALIVTGVGFLIHLYSTKYMEEDAGYHRFFAYLNLFIFAMLVLILGNSLPVLFVGWEGVGLCSYLLIGFWFEGEANAAAGKKAFIVNRIGDFGLLVAMALLLKYTGGLSWAGIESNAQGLLQMVPVWEIKGADFLPDWLIEQRHVSAATLVGLALFLGCAGKSAQIPLYVWLPDAMAGPTPVSALIHAATMVTAGVYLVCRMAPVFVLSPAAMFTVALIGALTAVFAATIAFVQNDIKKVLAYSTVSQLGYMFLGVGVGAFTAGFFHVITHAFFKACLFLGAGSVIHAMHARIHDTDASQDVRNMGGMLKFMPLTGYTFLASCAAIVGLPLTSGFFSKDEILFKSYTSFVEAPSGGSIGSHELFTWPEWGGTLLLILGVGGAVMTAFYMSRLFILTFLGDFKGWKIVRDWKEPEHEEHHHHHDDPGTVIEGPTPHESPWAMTLPLVVLGGLALVGGAFNAHAFFHFHPLDDWLEPVFASASGAVKSVEGHEELVMTLLVPGVLAFALGVGAAYWIYVTQKGKPAEEFVTKNSALHQLVYDKWRIDEVYDEFVVGTLDTVAQIFVWLDRWVVDGIIARLSSWLVAVFGHVLRQFQTGHVQAYAAVMVIGLAGVGWFVVTPQPDAQVQAAGNGEFTLTAAPGLGYAYRWDADGDGEYDTEDFGASPRISVQTKVGEEHIVRLEVRNAFGQVRSREFSLEQPRPDKSSADPEQATGALELQR